MNGRSRHATPPSAGLAGLLLAGGFSTRMGAWKPLLPLAGRVVVEHAARTLLGAGLSPVVLVAGHRAEELAPVAARLGLRLAVNPAPERGMLSSVRVGLLALPPGVAGCAVLPADMPAVRVRTVRQVVGSFQRWRPDVLHPTFEGRRGHPPAIAAALFPEILAGDGEGGLRAVLGRPGIRHREVPVVDEGIVLDLDTPGDLPFAEAACADRAVPTRRECAALLARAGTPERVVRHSEVVTAVAERLACGLRAAGLPVDLALVTAGAALHDVARVRPDHPVAGARMLRGLGHGRVAAVVAGHAELDPAREPLLDARAIVFLADKLVADASVVSLEERFRRAHARHGVDPAARVAIEARHRAARAVEGAVEAVLGVTVSTWLAGAPAGAGAGA